MATRKMALEAYMAHIREKRFTDYLAEMMSGPENIEVIEIETGCNRPRLATGRRGFASGHGGY